MGASGKQMVDPPQALTGPIEHFEPDEIPGVVFTGGTSGPRRQRHAGLAEMRLRGRSGLECPDGMTR